MDLFAQNPAATPLLRHLGRAIAHAAPLDWPVAELEVQVTEGPAGITRELRIHAPKQAGRTAEVPDHVQQLAAELEQMYASIGQRWKLFALTVTRTADAFRLNTYVELLR